MKKSELALILGAMMVAVVPPDRHNWNACTTAAPPEDDDIPDRLADAIEKRQRKAAKLKKNSIHWSHNENH